MTPDRDRYTSAYFDRAEDALLTARQNLESNHPAAAVNRAYYAAFYAASAVLNHSGETPSTHRGVKTRFHDLFVRNGRMDRDTAAILTVAEEARQNADYDAFSTFEPAAVRDLLTDVGRFVESCRALIG